MNGFGPEEVTRGGGGGEAAVAATIPAVVATTAASVEVPPPPMPPPPPPPQPPAGLGAGPGTAAAPAPALGSAGGPGPAGPGAGQLCCLREEGERCSRAAGNASFSKRIQKSISQKKVKIELDKSVSGGGGGSCALLRWSRLARGSRAGRHWTGDGRGQEGLSGFSLSFALVCSLQGSTPKEAPCCPGGGESFVAGAPLAEPRARSRCAAGGTRTRPPCRGGSRAAPPYPARPLRVSVPQRGGGGGGLGLLLRLGLQLRPSHWLPGTRRGFPLAAIRRCSTSPA